MIVVITVVPDKRLTVLLMEAVIVEVYFTTMACKKKVSFLNYSETISCFTFFILIKGNYYCQREINYNTQKILNTE